MAKIVIGSEYANEFDTICRLYKGGYLSNDTYIRRVTDNSIETATNVFVYSDRASGVNGSGAGGEAVIAFTGAGASWFAGIRNSKNAPDGGNAAWEQLIVDVAADYHKHYSLIEFKQLKDRQSLAAEDETVKRFKAEFIDRVFTECGDLGAPVKRGEELESIYGLSLRMEIGGGTGECKPVLGQLYFRNTPFGLAPLNSEEAVKIDAMLNTAAPEEGDMKKDEIVEPSLVGKVFNGLENVIEGGNFSDYVCFDGDDEIEIEKLLAQLANAEIKTLECSNIKVLGISHVQWGKSVYDVSAAGKRLLKISVGLNNSLSLSCLNCTQEEGASAYLIDGNSIIYPPDAEQTPVSEIDKSKRGFGLSDADIQAIKQYSEFKNHLFIVSCPENGRNHNCRKVSCASMATPVTVGDKTVYKCKGCRYPEIIYTDIFSGGNGKYTPQLQYAADKLTLVSDETRVCSCCGRRFTKEKISRDLCPFCQSGGFTKADAEAYKKYRGMLGLGIRLKHAFHKKSCREDGNVILFELGNDKYVLDKLSITEYGFNPRPKKFKRRYGR